MREVDKQMQLPPNGPIAVPLLAGQMFKIHHFFQYSRLRSHQSCNAGLSPDTIYTLMRLNWEFSGASH